MNILEIKNFMKKKHISQIELKIRSSASNFKRNIFR